MRIWNHISGLRFLEDKHKAVTGEYFDLFSPVVPYTNGKPSYTSMYVCDVTPQNDTVKVDIELNAEYESELAYHYEHAKGYAEFLMVYEDGNWKIGDIRTNRDLYGGYAQKGRGATITDLIRDKVGFFEAYGAKDGTYVMTGTMTDTETSEAFPLKLISTFKDNYLDEMEIQLPMYSEPIMMNTDVWPEGGLWAHFGPDEEYIISMGIEEGSLSESFNGTMDIITMNGDDVVEKNYKITMHLTE